MIKKNIIFGFILMLLGIDVFAQPVSAVAYETMLKVADEAADNHDFVNAITWLEKAYKESKDPNLKVEIGDLYMLIRDYKRAERSYAVPLKRDKTGDFEFIRVDYARALKYQGKYNDALEQLRTVVSTTESDSTRAVAQFELDGILSLDKMEPNLEAEVLFAGKEINSGSGENSPAEHPDGTMYYSSFNRTKPMVLDGKDEDIYAKIYTSTANKDGKFSRPKALDKKINREDYNSAGVSFSEDGKIMYFTRAKLDANKLTESKLYYATQSDAGWSAPRELTDLNGDYLILHPQEGELFGNKVLFFVSDMEGGYGGYDIYYSTINGDSYAAPVNLGPAINTEGDEITPFYRDGVLYFSTDGRPGFGGFDIWYATWNGSQFEGVTNMGYNYNSPQDDMYLKMKPGGNSAYLVSNRPDKNKRRLKGSATCCDDIYMVNVREIVIDLLVTVMGEDGPLPGVTVELLDLSVDDENAFDSKTNVTSNEFGFLLDADHRYRVVVSKDGYYPDTSISFNTVGLLDSYTVKKTVTLNPMPNFNPNGDGADSDGGVEIVKINEPIRLNNIYYDYNKWDILPDAEDDLGYLKSLMDQYPDMVIELASHTDARGKKSYNKILSQRRAESAKAWLVEQGISPSRIVAKGYGESMIINHCKDGVRCSDTEHRQNRRTEFKIIAGPKTIEIKKQVINKKYGGSMGHNGGSQSVEVDSFPVITFKENHIDIGTLVKGEKKEVVFHFTNTGNVPLVIEVVTACKCTDLEWPKNPVNPGESGEIRAVFDSTNQEIGKVEKTVDIIANTEIIVTEAFFHGNIVEGKKKAE